jgi:hypothetical protein
MAEEFSGPGEVRWFEHADLGGRDPERYRLTADQEEFMSVLRDLARAWPDHPDVSRQELPWAGRLQVWLDLDDPDNQERIIGTAAINFYGNSIVGDRTDGEVVMPDKPTSSHIEMTGSPEVLARAAAEWFEALLRRQIVRHEWLDKKSGLPIYQRWIFADSGECLISGGNHSLFRKGELGPPDRIVRVRGDFPVD